ncbi:hypothetical protein MIR68_011686 [Amoeboaphelidium protococcarum]|nr:hypothetical protein MIR68_011686 [Amoeboaphelidium protococcarum]
MKLIKQFLEKDQSGYVILYPEESEDMWHAYNLILPGDQLKATTVRRIQTSTSTGSSESFRQRINLRITVETLDYDPSPQTGEASIRINGRVCEENEYVKMGAYHTIDLELHRNFTLYKLEWDRVALDRVKAACDISERAELAAVVMHDGLANICLVTQNLTLIKQRIESSIPKKRRGTSTQHDKGLNRFFEQIMQGLLRHIRFDIVKVIIIASPGFLKDQFWTYLQAEMARSDHSAANRPLIENKSKFLLLHSNSGHKQALGEILADPAIQGRLQDTKYAQEVKILDQFFTTLSESPDKAFYGWNHVRKAADIAAIQYLLISDTLFRAADVPTRKKHIKLVEEVEGFGGQVFIFSSQHASGEQLDQLTGIAAILKYPAPQIEDDD